RISRSLAMVSGEEASTMVPVRPLANVITSPGAAALTVADRPLGDVSSSVVTTRVAAFEGAAWSVARVRSATMDSRWERAECGMFGLGDEHAPRVGADQAWKARLGLWWEHGVSRSTRERPLP